MRDISKEFSINWDSKALKERVSNSPASTYDGATKYRLSHDGKDDTVIGKQEIPWHGRAELTDLLIRKNGSALDHNIPEIQAKNGRYGTNSEAPHTGSNRNKLTDRSIKNNGNTIDHNINNGSAIDHNIPLKIQAKTGRNRTNSEAPHNGSNCNGLTDLSLKNSGSAIDHNIPERIQVISNHISHGRQVGGQTKSNLCADEDHDEKPRRSLWRKHLKLLVRENDPTGSNVKASRNPSDRKKSVRSIFSHCNEVDKEEMYMDELLIHYSKKKTTFDDSKIGLRLKDLIHRDADSDESPTERIKVETRLKPISALPPTRAMSLPPEPTRTEEVPRGPIRATSFKPDVNGRHVHPKLPDYDDLAAQFAALRGECKR
ncbi:uncharacterized protein LOC143856800 [Tasmannia lanceolata]|uniref:uncharacterized protein LOC143856800 n=1 Tax=Tasmannia lanceolata TaxID=3420 RepID=UPI004063CE32